MSGWTAIALDDVEALPQRIEIRVGALALDDPRFERDGPGEERARRLQAQL